MLHFQIVDIIADDLPNPEKGESKIFVITLYGKTIENKCVICNLIEFKPYFYMKIPFHWSKTSIKRFLIGDDMSGSISVNKLISGSKNYEPSNDFLEEEIKIIDSKDFYGFKCTSDKKVLQYKFAKLTFSSYMAMNKYNDGVREMYSKINSQIKSKNKVGKIYYEWFSQEKHDCCDSHLYESNVHPTLRFIHEKGITPASWISIPNDEISNSSLFPNAHIYIDELPYDKIKYHKTDNSVNYIIAAFDIECDSSHGDFPTANKDFNKLSIELYDSLINSAPSDTSIKQYCKLCIQAAFDESVNKKLYDINHKLLISQIYIKNNKKPVEICIDSFIELFDEQNFIDNFKDKKSRDKIIKQFNGLFKKFVDDKNKPLVVEGDKVIQIGTVFHKYGESKPYKRHILVIAPEDDLNDEEICSPLDDYDIEVICCKNEKELLLRWKDIIKSEDPDFITGYNILGFDFGYMIDRMKVYCKCGKSRYCKRDCSYKQFFNMGKINTSVFDSYHYYNKRCSEKMQKSASFIRNDNYRYISMDGRILYDLQKEIEKNHNLESYKLDNVAAHFMKGKINNIKSTKNKSTDTFMCRSYLYTNEFGHLKDGDYISLKLHSNIGETYFKDGKKYKVILNKSENYIQLTNYVSLSKKNMRELENGIRSLWTPTNSEYFKVEWCLKKDDVSPQDIFKKHKTGKASGRAEIAKYCIQDCELCINLSLNLDIIPNSIAMANVCYVPLSYIFMRGQGAKIFSLISRECNLHNIRIPTLKKPFNPYDYVEGYQDNGIDEMREILIYENYENRYENKIDCNIEYEKDKGTPTKQNPEGSGRYKLNKYKKDKEEYKYEHNTTIYKPYKGFEIEQKLVEIGNPPPRAGYEGAIVLDPVPGIYTDDPIGVVDYASLYPSSIIEKNISHDTLIEESEYLQYVDYETIIYDNYIYEEEEGKITISKKICPNNPKVTCHFLKKQEGEPLGVIPMVVQHLLDQRKATKKRLKNETNELKKKVLDGLQLSYKLVANSVYGQMGARTSPIYKNKLAACTTAIGRERIYDAKGGVEDEWFHKSEWALENECQAPQVIYGDTDSVFIKWSPYKKGTKIEGKELLKFCIDCGKDAGKWITENKLHKPQDLEYEKTFYPFILISKKRYIGDKYEFDIDECKRTSMGIVLKRRDNAPIVKHVFGNVIETIMIDKDLHKSVDWLRKTLQNIRQGKFSINQFIITKSLRGYYKNPQGIAHKVLADRIGDRDPGNRPKPGDRIPFVYHEIDEKPEYVGDYKNGKKKFKKKKILQGERVEDPDFIYKNKLPLDYEFYITNQIMNPVKQVLDLGMNELETTLIFKK